MSSEPKKSAKRRSSRKRGVFKKPKRCGICLDSLHQVPPGIPSSGNSYELVIIDEAEQVLRHLFAKTITERGTRSRILFAFRTIIRNAKYVVALDADLDFLTHATLSRIEHDRHETESGRATKLIHLWINETSSPDRKAIELYANKNHLIDEIVHAVADGKRVFVTANSKALINKIAAFIRDRFGGTRRLIAVTSETGSQADVQRLVADPGARATDYDVILCSPSMGTGVDITFPGNATLIDVVFGFCEPGITTHRDFDQQIARVRHPGTIKIWITPRRNNYETHLDVVRHDILRAGLYKDLLDGYEDDGRPRFVQDDPLIEMAAIAKSAERASLNNLRGNYVLYKQAQGCTFVHIGKDLDRSIDGHAALKRGTDLADEERAARIMAAAVLTRPDYTRLQKAIEAGEVLTEATRWSLERTHLELFYRSEATPELVRLDRGGSRRGEIRVFQEVTRLPPEALPTDLLEPLHRDLSFLAEDQLDLAPTVVRLLRLTPLWRGQRHDPLPDGAIDAGRGRLAPPPGAKKLAEVGRVAGSFDPEAVFDAEDLQAFARLMLANKGPLETVLGHEVRSDIRKKPTQQLGLVLRKMGLGLAQAGTSKVAGRKIYRYRLDPVALAAAEEIADRRERKGGWAFLVDRYGPHMDPSDGDDATESDASIERVLAFLRRQRGTSQEGGGEDDL